MAQAEVSETMKAQGTCPHCGRTVGVEVQDTVVEMMKDTIEQMVDKDGNRMHCSNCQRYVEPESVDVITDY